MGWPLGLWYPDSVRADPDQSGLGCFYTILFWLGSNRFREAIHQYPHVTNAPHPSVCVVLQWIVQNFWSSDSIVSLVWKTVSKGWNGRPCKAFEWKEKQDEAGHEVSAIASPLASVDSVLYPVFVSYRKHARVSSLFDSAKAIPDTRYTYITVCVGNWVTWMHPPWLAIQFNLDQNHIVKWIDSNQFEIDSIWTSLSVEGMIPVQSRLNPDWNRITWLV